MFSGNRPDRNRCSLLHEAGEPDCESNVGVSGPGITHTVLSKAGDCNITAIADIIKKQPSKYYANGNSLYLYDYGF
ncbi:MAG TPA: hypothetical protein IAA80_02615 [Candidatus Gallacutalibacter pullistercoris]|nr:hypothetical protein [Candidatus Gallacutalibacter pullistercoris]